MYLWTKFSISSFVLIPYIGASSIHKMLMTTMILELCDKKEITHLFEIDGALLNNV
jgi:hypothetical protein